MTKDPDVLRKLAALVAEPTFNDDGAMVLCTAGDRSATAALLRAIDNTVLPRDLVFSVGSVSLTVSVGARRLRMVVAASSALKVPQELIGKLLTPQDVPAITDIGKIVRSLTHSSGELTLVRQPIAGSAATTDAGIGVDNLVAAWGVKLDTKPPTRLERFVRALGPNVVAMIAVDTETATKVLGQDALVQDLKQLWFAQFETNFATISGQTEGPQFVYREGLSRDNPCTCLVKVNKIKVLISISGGNLPMISTAWVRSL